MLDLWREKMAIKVDAQLVVGQPVAADAGGAGGGDLVAALRFMQFVIRAAANCGR